MRGLGGVRLARRAASSSSHATWASSASRSSTSAPTQRSCTLPCSLPSTSFGHPYLEEAAEEGEPVADEGEEELRVGEEGPEEEEGPQADLHVLILQTGLAREDHLEPTAACTREAGEGKATSSLTGRSRGRAASARVARQERAESRIPSAPPRFARLRNTPASSEAMLPLASSPGRIRLGNWGIAQRGRRWVTEALEQAAEDFADFEAEEGRLVRWGTEEERKEGIQSLLWLSAPGLRQAANRTGIHVGILIAQLLCKMRELKLPLVTTLCCEGEPMRVGRREGSWARVSSSWSRSRRPRAMRPWP